MKMEDKQLDDLIGGKIKDIERPYESDTWLALQTKIEQTQVQADKAFDDTVKHKMQRLEPSYQSWYWSLLATKLDEEAALKKQLIQYKSIELLLALLLIFTCIHCLPTAYEKLSQSKAEKTATSHLDEKVETATALCEDSASASHHLALSNSHLETTTKSVTYNIVTPTNSSIAIDKAEVILSNLAKLPINLIPLAPAAIVPNEIKVANINIMPASMPAFTPEALTHQHWTAIPNDKLWGISPLITANKSKKQIRVGMFAALNGDYIYTPDDAVLNLPAYARVATDYGGGFSVALEWKRWAIETGLIYNHKEYSPEQVPIFFGNSIDGYYVEGLRNIELNTFKVPIQIRYEFKQSEKWHLYTLGGAAIHVATQANYDVTRIGANQLYINTNVATSKGEITLTKHQFDRFSKFSKPSEPQSDKLNRKQFEDGWMSGGSFKENSFYTLNFGMGAERYLDERWSLFIEPSYQQNINIFNKGIGPNQDKISTLQILIGAKVGL